jgi:arsenate reductase
MTARPPTERIRRAGMRRPRVLLLSPRHAARAPMAEAILRSRVLDAIDLVSAGLEPAPLHPFTLTVLEEAGLALHAHKPIPAKSLLGRFSFSTAIIISGPRDAVRPRMFFGALTSVHWELDDPSLASEGTRLAAFRECRDHLSSLVDQWVQWNVKPPAVARAPEPTPKRAMRIPKPNLI